MTTNDVRLWNHRFAYLATAQVDEKDIREHDDQVRITIRGAGPMRQAIRESLDQHPWDHNLYVTVDNEPVSIAELPANRRGGIVLQLEITDHKCECGNTILTTEITALSHKAGVEAIANDLRITREAIYPPRGYGIGMLGGGNGDHAIIGCWATEDEARQAINDLHVFALGDARPSWDHNGLEPPPPPIRIHHEPEPPSLWRRALNRIRR